MGCHTPPRALRTPLALSAECYSDEGGNPGIVTELLLLPVQCKMARAALDWGVRELAAKADKSPNTIARFERGEDMPRETIAEIRAALELGGVEFVAEDEASSAGGAGVRVTMPVRRKRSK